MTPRMFSSTRKCWPSCLLRDDVHRPNAASAFASIRRASSPWSSPLACASAASVCIDERGLVAPPADGLRRKIRAVGLGEEPLGRDAPCRRAELGRLRVGHVACEGDVPAALERRLEERSGGEAVEDDRAGEAGEARERVVVGRARVDHHGLAQLVGERELRLEQPAAAPPAARSPGSGRARLADRERPPRTRAARGARRDRSASSPPLFFARPKQLCVPSAPTFNVCMGIFK